MNLSYQGRLGRTQLFRFTPLIFIFLLGACGGGGGSGNDTTNRAAPNTAPTISGTPDLVVNVDNPYSFIPEAGDADGDSLTFSATNLPSWLSLNTDTGELSGTPLSVEAQLYSNITVTVEDSNGASASLAAFDLLVNSSPSTNFSQQLLFVGGTKVELRSNALDPEQHSFSVNWSQISGPAVSFDASNPNLIFTGVLVTELVELVFNIDLVDQYGASFSEQITLTLKPDDVAPNDGVFVLIAAPTPTSVTLSWYPGVDNVTPAEDMNYRLYMGLNENFTADGNTLLGEYNNQTSLEVDELVANTQYFFKLLITDGQGNTSANTAVSSITTPAIEAILTKEVIETNEELNLGIAEIDENTPDVLTFSEQTNSQMPTNDAILIGEDSDGNGFLVRVVSTTSDNGKIIVNTQPAALTDVLEQGQFSSQVLMKSFVDAPSNNNIIQSRISKKGINRQGQVSWQNDVLRVTETGMLPNNQRLLSRKQGKHHLLGKIEEVLPIDVEFGENVTLSGQLNFQPVIKTNVTISNFNVDKVTAHISGHLILDTKLAFDYAKKASTSKQKNFFKRTFINKYLVGGVPVYQETTLFLDAKFTGSAETQISASLNNHVSTSLGLNVVYENDEWQSDTTTTFDKALTIKAEVQGAIEAQVRVIPRMQIRFYKVATVNTTVEPYVRSTLEVEAVSAADLVDLGTMAEYSFNTIDAFIGGDIKLNADLTAFGYNIAKYPDSGMKTLYHFEDLLFRLPKLEAVIEGIPNIHGNELALVGNTTSWKSNFFENVKTEIDPLSIRWVVFPGEVNEPGETTYWKPEEHGNIYDIYFIGHSKQLGPIAQQYVKLELDMRDSDADGMPNAWEEFYGFDPEDAYDALEDPDLDQINNVEEYVNVTDPMSGVCYEDYTVDSNTAIDLENLVQYTTEEIEDNYSNKYTWMPTQESEGVYKNILIKREYFYDNNPTPTYVDIYEPINDLGCLTGHMTESHYYDKEGWLSSESAYGARKSEYGYWNFYLEGETKYYYEDGTVRSISTYKIFELEDGGYQSVEHGMETYYHENSELESTVNKVAKLNSDGYYRSIYEGEYKKYYNNGEPSSITTYEPFLIDVGENIGDWGSVPNGPYTSYDENGNLLVSSTHKRLYNTLRDYYEYKFEGEYLVYWPNGNLHITQTAVPKYNQIDEYWQQLYEGEVKFYYEDNQLAAETTYKAMQSQSGYWEYRYHGAYKSYWNNGNPSEIYTNVMLENGYGYFDSYKDGHYIQYNINGFKYDEINYEIKIAETDNEIFPQSLRSGQRIYYYFDNNRKDYEQNYTLHQNTNGTWNSVTTGIQASYHNNEANSISSITNMQVAKQNDNGYWIGVIDGTVKSYDSENVITYDTPYTPLKNMEGYWQSVRHGVEKNYSQGLLWITYEYDKGVLVQTCYYNSGVLNYCS